MPPYIRVPGRKPHHICGNSHGAAFCTRPRGHSGRHAWIWWGMGGIVRAVWGEKYQREVPC